MTPPPAAIAFAEAKNNLSALTASANETNTAFTILKNNKPWVRVQPLAARRKQEGAVSIVPLKREVEVPDLDDLFEGFDGPIARMSEDGFAGPAGWEAM